MLREKILNAKTSTKLYSLFGCLIGLFVGAVFLVFLPYYEDDLPQLAEVIGVDKILFGSDWPHGEGLESPVSFTAELVGFSDTEIRKIMRDNALGLLGVPVGSAV